jgi:hypothetical protein
MKNLMLMNENIFVAPANGSGFAGPMKGSRRDNDGEWPTYEA